MTEPWRWVVLPGGKVAHARTAAGVAECGIGSWGGGGWEPVHESVPRCKRCTAQLARSIDEPESITPAPGPGPMAAGVDAAIAAAGPKVRDMDAGAVALARRYAALIDEATPASKYRENLAAIMAAFDTLEAAWDGKVGVDYRKHFDKICDALAAHSVMSDLGPKLLATLAALGLTVAAAGTTPAKGGQTGDSGAVATSSRLDELRARRAQRPGGNGA